MTLSHQFTLSLAAMLGILATPAQAQDAHEDVQIWTYVTVKAPLAERLDLSLDLHVGIIDDASKPNQFLTRGVLSYKLDKRFSIGAGYTFVSYHDSPVVVFDEHRLTQEVSFRSTTKPDHVLLLLRPRIEERFREGEGGTSVRLRHLTRVDLPISSKGLKLVG